MSGVEAIAAPAAVSAEQELIASLKRELELKNEIKTVTGINPAVQPPPTLVHVPLLALTLLIIWGLRTWSPVRVSFIFTLIAQALFLHMWAVRVSTPPIITALLSMLLWIPYISGVDYQLA